MKKHSFVFGAILLAVGGFLAKAIGAIYKIPLANVLGANGIGVYYQIFPIYALLIILVSGGVSIAVSKMISYERASNNRKNEVTIFAVAILFVFVLSIVCSLALVLLSNQIAFWQGNVNAKLGFVAIAPAIVFSSLIAVVRAYFQGLQNMIPTSFSNVVEQIVKVVFGLILSNMLIPYGIQYAVFGAILSVTISEFVAFLIIVVNYIFYKRKLRYYHEPRPVTSKTLTANKVFKKLLVYSIPAMLSSIIIPITAFLDSFMVMNLLTGVGNTTSVSTSLYGIHNGIVNTLIGIPVIFTLAISTAIVPNLSSFHATNNKKEIELKSSFFIKLSWILSLISCVMLIVFSSDIIVVLFSRGLSEKVINEFDIAYKLLILSSISVVYYAFLQTFTSILQSINKTILPFISLFIAIILRTLLVFVFVRYANLNIFGVVLAHLVFLSVATILNIAFLRRFVQLRFKPVQMFGVPIVSALIAGIISFLVKVSLFNYLNTIFYTAIAGLVGVAVYLLLLFTLKTFNRQELKMMPNFSKILKRSKK